MLRSEPVAPQRPAPLEAGTWVLDSEASRVSFRAASFCGLLPVRGFVPVMRGTATVGPAGTSVAATIHLAAVDTGMALRDRHLRGPDFFEVDRYPVSTFTSSQLTGGGGQWTLAGSLTVRDTTALVSITGTADPEPDGSVRVHAIARVDRNSVGLTGLRGMIPATVRLTVSARLVRTDPPTPTSEEIS